MGIYKVADGAYFVPSYSLQTIAPGFENAATVQSLSGSDEAAEAEEQSSRRILSSHDSVSNPPELRR